MIDKFILDACCGSRMFWWNKQHPNTIFIDNREYDKGFIDNRLNRELHPDKIMDFRKLDFPDKSFNPQTPKHQTDNSETDSRQTGTIDNGVNPSVSANIQTAEDYMDISAIFEKYGNHVARCEAEVNNKEGDWGIELTQREADIESSRKAKEAIQKF